MKKIKWTIMTLAIVTSVGGALATRPQGDCRTAQQYVPGPGGFMPAGTWGVNYLCDASSNTCTYTTDGFGHYFPCRTGDYRVLPGITGTQAAKK
jgi:hypothetical protein